MNTKCPLISYEMIERAINGDLDTLNDIRAHYHSYSPKLSLRVMKDESGNSHTVVDEFLRSRLEDRLLRMILSFEIR
ncbi:helix-turn-helix domain-containing protein [Lactobacillus sp. UCMA15818]|uniref:helix-turn-helix domain-containing protein n=1 Tax=Lactobacillus sp. UCMA15818 TaxID=2583394 RepID=UPI0025AF7903|nr:helix-turn-helix domain-containing protein [Lactobacillus sp. UCMA15818]MDN2454114.1 helix-turn-helix domain-containing protein [Lactobacillus sp. UCMA15818]